MDVTATEAKNRLGQVLEHAQRRPVFIQKAGRRHSVVISSERYEQLLKLEAGQSMAARRRQFNEQHKEWIAEVNRHFDEHGLWNDEFRTW